MTPGKGSKYREFYDLSGRITCMHTGQKALEAQDTQFLCRSEPIVQNSPVRTFFQQPLSLQLEEEVASLLSKGAVEEIIPECPG